MVLLLRILLTLALAWRGIAQDEALDGSTTESPGVLPATAFPGGGVDEGEGMEANSTDAPVDEVADGDNGTDAPQSIGNGTQIPSIPEDGTAEPGANSTLFPIEFSSNGTLAPSSGPPPPAGCEEGIDFEYYKTRTIRDIIHDRSSLHFFQQSLAAVDLYDTLLANETARLTILAPWNHAIEQSHVWMKYLANFHNWKMNLRHTVYNHILENQNLTAIQLEDDAESHVSLEDRLYGDLELGHIESANIVCTIPASNGYLHIVDSIMIPKFFDHTLRDLEMMEEFGPDREVQQRVSLVDVVDFLGARHAFERDLVNGTTHVGCRIRAFNRMDDYFKQTINQASAEGVKWGELLNQTFKNESYHNFIEYNLINHVYNNEDMEHGYEELIMADNWCAHMWVTKHEDKICFNNACLVIAPPSFAPIGTAIEKRIQLASNGIAYVVDKCLICPGISMLTEYAGEYTTHNMKEISQFLTASEWNRRNLSLSVGDGGPVTLFAAITNGWSELTGEDITRLSTDMYKPHQRDFLRHMMVQGNYTEAQLRGLVHQSNGLLNMTNLANQTLYFEVDKDRDVLMLDGGDVYFSDVHGVDGMVHFITKVPLVRSVTHSVYEIGHWLGNHIEQLRLIDNVFLDSDMKRLEPMTAMYAPDDDWMNKVIKLDDVEPILENHLFKALLWCDVLLDKAAKGETIWSLSEVEWGVSVNDFGKPCLDTIDHSSGLELARSCITECDHLARNGIVHTVDKVILAQEVTTTGPTPPLPPGARPPPVIKPQNPYGDQPPWLQDTAINKGPSDGKPVSYERPKRQDYWGQDDETNDSNDDKSSAFVRATLLATIMPLLVMLL